MPIARDFDPELVVVAAGFDAASGHPPQLGGYKVTPASFAWMTKQLMTLAHGKVVLALEGGYVAVVVAVADVLVTFAVIFSSLALPPLTSYSFMTLVVTFSGLLIVFSFLMFFLSIDYIYGHFGHLVMT